MSTITEKSIPLPSVHPVRALGQALCSRPDFAATFVLFPLTLILCALWGLKPNLSLPIHFVLPWLFKVVVISIVTLLIYFIYMGVTGRWQEVRSNQLSLNGYVINTLLILGMAWIYTHIKAGVLLRRETHDAWLYNLDKGLFFGNEPWVVLRQIIPAIFAEALSVVYMLLFPMITGSVLWLSLIKKDKRANDLTCAVILNYYIGVLAYHALPAYGPCYFCESASTANLSALTSGIQNRLIVATQAVHSDPSNVMVMPWIYIAAFPSLHISLTITLYWYMRHHRTSRWIFGAFLILTAISTIYLGWHYVVDWVGGIAVAIPAIWLTSRFQKTGEDFR